MTQQLSARPYATPDATPAAKFARHRDGKYEYGHITVNHVDRSKDKYNVLGKCASMAAAMKSNQMTAL